MEYQQADPELDVYIEKAAKARARILADYRKPRLENEPAETEEELQHRANRTIGRNIQRCKSIIAGYKKLIHDYRKEHPNEDNGFEKQYRHEFLRAKKEFDSERKKLGELNTSLVISLARPYLGRGIIIR